MTNQQLNYNTRSYKQFIIDNPQFKRNSLQGPSTLNSNNQILNSTLLNNTSHLSPNNMSLNTTQNWQSYRLPPATFLSNQPSILNNQQYSNQYPKDNIMDYRSLSDVGHMLFPWFCP